MSVKRVHVWPLATTHLTPTYPHRSPNSTSRPSQPLGAKCHCLLFQHFLYLLHMSLPTYFNTGSYQGTVASIKKRLLYKFIPQSICLGNSKFSNRLLFNTYFFVCAFGFTRLVHSADGGHFALAQYAHWEDAHSERYGCHDHLPRMRSAKSAMSGEKMECFRLHRVSRSGSSHLVVFSCFGKSFLWFIEPQNLL